MLTLGCQHARDPRLKISFWLIDNKESVLYRVISDTEEQTLQIKGNQAVKNFVCMDRKEADAWIESYLSEDK